MKTIVLATSNPHKVAEMEPTLQAHGFEVRLQTEFFAEQVEEDGAGFIENALKKARFASSKTGLPAIADDSGLQVAHLDGAPGVYSARFANLSTGKLENASDQANREKLLAALQGLSSFKDRQANYFCAVVYVAHAEDPTPKIGFGTWQGDIVTEARTQYGIGYDPIFWVSSELRVASEVSLERKAQVSHRAQALRAVLNQLKQAE